MVCLPACTKKPPAGIDSWSQGPNPSLPNQPAINPAKRDGVSDHPTASELLKTDEGLQVTNDLHPDCDLAWKDEVWEDGPGSPRMPNSTSTGAMSRLSSDAARAACNHFLLPCPGVASVSPDRQVREQNHSTETTKKLMEVNEGVGCDAAWDLTDEALGAVPLMFSWRNAKKRSRSLELESAPVIRCLLTQLQ